MNLRSAAMQGSVVRKSLVVCRFRTKRDVLCGRSLCTHRFTTNTVRKLYEKRDGGDFLHSLSLNINLGSCLWSARPALCEQPGLFEAGCLI